MMARIHTLITKFGQLDLGRTSFLKQSVKSLQIRVSSGVNPKEEDENSNREKEREREIVEQRGSTE